MTAQQVYSKVKDSVVVIETYDSSSIEATSAGSGIIMSSDGYIITNEHVIDGATSVKVILSDKKEYTAKVIGSDKRTDLAVIKIDATGSHRRDVRQFRPARRRRIGARHRQLGGARRLRHQRHHIGAEYVRDHREQLHREMHPDRRPHQSRQFRRRAR
jgi:S1-C subfamily serine protease